MPWQTEEQHERDMRNHWVIYRDGTWTRWIGGEVHRLDYPVGDTYDPSLPTWLLLGRPDLAVTPERKTA